MFRVKKCFKEIDNKLQKIEIQNEKTLTQAKKS